jgi:hypothetical protein
MKISTISVAPITSPRLLGMARLREGQVFGWQGHQVSDKLFCFKYTSKIEQSEYGRPTGYTSCYAENLCAENLAGETYFTIDHNVSDITVSEFGSLSIKSRRDPLPEGHIYLNSTLSIIQSVFQRWNPVSIYPISAQIRVLIMTSD